MTEDQEKKTVYYYGTHLHERHGPVSQSELRELASTGKLAGTDRVWQDNSEKSAQAANVKGLFQPDSGNVNVRNPPATVVTATAVDCDRHGVVPKARVDYQHSQVNSVASRPLVDFARPTSVGQPLFDARPLVPRKADGLFAEIENLRDEIHKVASEHLAARGLMGNVLRSHPLVHPCWVSIEVWQPVDGDSLLTARSSAVVKIDAKPYHRHEYEFILELDCRGRSRKCGSLAAFGSKEVSRTIDYLVGQTKVPKFSNVQLRRYPWELWKLRNKPEALSRDWLGMIPGILCVLGFILLAILPLGIILFVAAGISAVLTHRRERVVRTSGKPIGEPRNLFCLDSWQTIVFGVGSETNGARSRIATRLQKPFSSLMRFRPENIWYWGLDGVSEREQFVVTHGRAIVFVHIHQYGNDLYVAWDGHLNRGQWVEKDLYQGVDKRSGRLAIIRVVEAGQQRLNEYDLTDANSMMEWVHAQVVQVIKQIMVEQKIDQEIDFKVIRGERQGVTTGDDTARDKIERFTDRAKNLLRRVG